MGVPNVFGSATTSIPLSQLDANFNTTATLGNTAVGLGNVTTTVGNLTLTNVNIVSGTSNIASGNSTAIVSGTSNVVVVSSGGNVTVATNNAERMRIDTSGNVGIGTTSPQSTVGVNVALSDTKGVVLQYNGEAKAGILLNPTGGEVRMGAINATGSYFTTLYANNAEAMRITSTGQLMVNTTSITGSPDNLQLYPATTGAFQYGMMIGGNGTSYTVNAMRFVNTYTPAVVGTIVIGSSSTAYNTSSDYRLKENVAPMTGALNTVSLLKPVTYKWKNSGEDGQGFIAHELAEIVPEAVTGEKDALDAEGNPVYQGIDTSFLVATLTAAIQELKSIVDTQATQIAALQTKVGA